MNAAEETLALKQAIRDRIEAARDDLLGLSHRIHEHPELGYEEEQASTWVSEALSEAGLAVELGIHDIDTAFVGRAGSGPLELAICAEYDALPGVGHACGHNIIAAAAAGAALGLRACADDLEITLRVVGTPAEEVGDAGGKILLLERGAFAGAHAAMMVHPTPFEAVAPPLIAASSFRARYTGRAAHAGAAPEQGINAADALTVAQTSIGLLRQHLEPNDRVHGIVTEAGESPNTIPRHSCAHYMVRAHTMERLAQVRERVFDCFRAGALASGAELELIGGDRPYAQVRHDLDIAELYRRNAEALEREFPDLGPVLERFTPSTDMGNVSLEIPSIHPYLGLGCWPVVNHQPEFAAHCVSGAADDAVVHGAVAMAWTAVDVARDPELRRRLIERAGTRAA